MSDELKATPAQIAEVKLLVPGIANRINEFQLDTIAANLDFIMFKDVTVRKFLPHMVQAARATTHDLVDVVRKINFAKLGPKILEQRQLAIDTVGYAIQPVFASEHKAAFAYTIGLADRVGFELMATAGSDPHLLMHIVGQYAELAKAHEHIEHERNDTAAMADRPKQGVRTKAIAVEPLVVRQEYAHGLPADVKRVYQILIADKNNIFPDEQGYDREWSQPRLPRPLLG
jgi:hypothetical protein